MLSPVPFEEGTGELGVGMELVAVDALVDEATTVGVGVRAKEVGRATLRDLR